MAARLRQPRQAPRQAMTTDDVQAVIAASVSIDPAAALALRLAAAAGLRRAELAALRWDDLDGDRLTVDSSVARDSGEAGASVLVDAPTKTANRRVVRLDADTVAAIEALGQERSVISPYLFSFDENPPPAVEDRVVVDPGPLGGRDRPEVASPRPQTRVGNRRHQRRPRCPHRRRPTRSRQPGHDAAGVRPRRRGRRRGDGRRPRPGSRSRRRPGTGPESRLGPGTLVVMGTRFDLWVDYHRRDADGLTHAHVDDVESGHELVPGSFAIVGNSEADPAVAEVVAIDDDGLVLRVLPGPAEHHLHRVTHLHQAG